MRLLWQAVLRERRIQGSTAGWIFPPGVQAATIFWTSFTSPDVIIRNTRCMRPFFFTWRTIMRKQEFFWKAIRINPIQEMIWSLLEFICICARLPVYIRTRFTPCPESAIFTCKKVTVFRFYGSCWSWILHTRRLRPRHYLCWKSSLARAAGVRSSIWKHGRSSARTWLFFTDWTASGGRYSASRQEETFLQRSW